ncbi:MAG TPA: glycosyltransferase family 2 protein [Acidimicrobiales bacterium]|nr:glycosyltransferase family 2 protein [Acidimicrobiales bacterium]
MIETHPHDPADGIAPLVSIVTVTWNSAGVIPGILRSIHSTLAPESYELIVIDNGSKDGTVDLVHQLAPEAAVIANPRNRGLAAANNQGLDAAKAEFIVICNPDVLFKSGAVTEMLQVMTRHPSAGWVVPRQRHEDGRLLTTAGDLPTLSEALLGRTLAGWSSQGTTQGQWWDGWAHDEERAIPRGQEAVYMIRRAALEQVGPQDERYVLDWEGPDWTDRFRKAGWEIWLAPAAEVVHLGGTSVRQARLRWIASTHRGMYYYFSDRLPKPSRPVLAATICLRALVKMVGAVGGLPLYRWAHGAATTRAPRQRASN